MILCYNWPMPRNAPGKEKDRTLCHTYCTYYKPGKNEEFLCEGYVVVHRIQGGGKVLRERPERLAAPDEETLKALRDRVCGRCSFRANDCDYSATAGRLPACGGIVLLSHLLGSGDLTLNDIDQDRRDADDATDSARPAERNNRSDT